MGSKVLDYHDILLRQEDVALLSGSGWLNDQAELRLVISETSVLFAL